MAGVVSRDLLSNSIAPSNPTAMFGNPATFTAAANTQGSDYDKIMAQYAALAKSYSNDPVTPTPVTTSNIQIAPTAPVTAPYTQSQNVTGSLANLSDLATTGGYSKSDIENIRERDISPIRSIYANAKQNIERQRALAGGYSPNFNAVSAKMARDESSQIGDITTKANADIAQNVAGNRISAAAPYASASANANAAKTASDKTNADILNNMSQFNDSLQSELATSNANRTLNTDQFNTTSKVNTALANRQGAQSATGGMTSIYGTTPALVNTFGNQVVQAGQMSLGQQQANNNRFNTVTRFG